MALNFKGDYKFFHVPKTGGNYVREVLKQSFAPTQLAEGKHPHSGGLDHGGRHVFDHSFCCVRAPYTWYKSFYRYRVQNGWKTDYPIDIHCRAATYDEFIWNILKIWDGNPHGFVTGLYLKYIPFCKHILRMESLTGELKQLFAMWNMRWPENIKHINVSNPKIDTHLSPRTRERLRSVDSGMTAYLGYDKSGNSINHTVG